MELHNSKDSLSKYLFMGEFSIASISTIKTQPAVTVSGPSLSIVIAVGDQDTDADPTGHSLRLLLASSATANDSDVFSETVAHAFATTLCSFWTLLTLLYISLQLISNTAATLVVASTSPCMKPCLHLPLFLSR